VTSKKLGALLRSVPPATARAEVSESPQPPAAPEPTPQLQWPGPTAKPTAEEREVPLQVLIPESIRRQLGVKAAEEGRSLRELVLAAIRSLDIDVTDAQIKGKRGRKSV
jgi:hypothetical protein